MNNLSITEEERKIDYSDLLFQPLPEVDPKLLAEMDLSPAESSIAPITGRDTALIKTVKHMPQPFRREDSRWKS